MDLQTLSQKEKYSSNPAIQKLKKYDYLYFAKFNNFLIFQPLNQKVSTQDSQKNLNPEENQGIFIPLHVHAVHHVHVVHHVQVLVHRKAHVHAPAHLSEALWHHFHPPISPRAIRLRSYSLKISRNFLS